MLFSSKQSQVCGLLLIMTRVSHGLAIQRILAYIVVFTHYLFLGNFFSAKERLFPVADATSFFTDLHFILRVIADGNIRTVCHHRLNLLEQVFDELSSLSHFITFLRLWFV